ncbi:hypothetical protein F3Y22_tig00110383pilonHSYRG00104 [Hibiscus syriacus]|uniref:Alcohol dehydrogenase-like C-terminal domain-containing protein n=1 Tax=Hibiscus syriacus TaxID=106335 RepID=A0A6A3AUF8_HIBSY|nr:hypothetical protein F3Y22_tig00110383pilonHSYRG00104 [Hibiscus syriacus]
MKAIVITTAGGPEGLQLQQVEDPELKNDEVLIKVEATALNRADTLQRKGVHPPKVEVDMLRKWQFQLVKFFQSQNLKDAAGLPEVAYEPFVPIFSSNIYTVCWLIFLSEAHIYEFHPRFIFQVTIGVICPDIRPQRASLVICDPFLETNMTAIKISGNEEKLAFCKKLGADVASITRQRTLLHVLRKKPEGRVCCIALIGVDVILDCIGAAYLRRNLDSLNFDGRLCIIGLQSGAVA